MEEEKYLTAKQERAIFEAYDDSGNMNAINSTETAILPTGVHMARIPKGIGYMRCCVSDQLFA